jgi:hypothetical protein
MGGTVPLSEHEQRQLEQIEQALYSDYPRFANAVRASDPRVHYRRRVIEAALGFVLGVGMLLAGVLTRYLWIGVAGFVVMVACAMWALTSYRHMNGVASSRSQGKSKKKQRRKREPSSGLMERMEERWRRRQERGR